MFIGAHEAEYMFVTTLLKIEHYLIDNPEALSLLANQRAQNGQRCATKQELLATADLLAQATPMLQK